MTTERYFSLVSKRPSKRSDEQYDVLPAGGHVCGKVWLRHDGTWIAETLDGTPVEEAGNVTLFATPRAAALRLLDLRESVEAFMAERFAREEGDV